jgi:hypothetical protein
VNALVAKQRKTIMPPSFVARIGSWPEKPGSLIATAVSNTMLMTEVFWIGLSAVMCLTLDHAQHMYSALLNDICECREMAGFMAAV